MIKTVKMALLSTIIGTSLYAGNYDSNAKGFIGLELGYATVDGQQLANDGYYNFQEGEDVEYGLRIGAQNDEWRATFAFHYYDNTDADQSVEKALVMVDYFFIQNPDATIRPFIGANLGAVNYESSFVDVTDFIYGGQVGVIVKAGENLDVDLSYRYSIAGSEELNDLSSLILGLNYLY
jgi:hypothetical protein